MKPLLTVKQVVNNAAALRQAVKALTEQDVYIGVPAEHAGSRKGGITNAELSYIHEFGAPAAGIPARPHLVPGVERIRDDAAQLLKDGAARAMEGNVGAVERNLTKIGQLGQNSVRAMFQDNDWPPLADTTLDYAPLKKDDEGNVVSDKKGQPKRGKSRREKGKLNPLLDTAQLMKSHTFVIRKRGGRMITP